MKITMNEERKFYADGVTARTLEKGKTYDLDDAAAQGFVDDKSAAEAAKNAEVSPLRGDRAGLPPSHHAERSVVHAARVQAGVETHRYADGGMAPVPTPLAVPKVIETTDAANEARTTEAEGTPERAKKTVDPKKK